MIKSIGKSTVLPRISLKSFNNSVLHKPFLVSGRSSTTITDEGLKISEKDDLESHFFPWRNRPMALTHNVTFLAKFFLYTMNYPKEDFLIGAQAAFECAVSAIFQNNDLLKHNELVDIRFLSTKNSDSPDDTSPSEPSVEIEDTEEIPSLEDIVDDRLSVFYGNAVKKMLLQPNRKIFYKLLRVNSATIARGDLLFYSDVDRVEHEFLVRHDAFYGLLGSLHPQLRKEKSSSSSTSLENEKEDETQHADSIITNLKSSKSRSQNDADCVLLRLWVDLHCKGITVINVESSFLLGFFCRGILCERYGKRASDSRFR
jgi:hypothetical protein